MKLMNHTLNDNAIVGNILTFQIFFPILSNFLFHKYGRKTNICWHITRCYITLMSQIAFHEAKIKQCIFFKYSFRL